MEYPRPWLRHYGGVPESLGYPDGTLYDAVRRASQRTPDAVALDFFGTETTYAKLVAAIDRCAGALAGLGLGRGDRLMISLPTSPQAVIAFYAANRLGAVAAMVHPLSTPAELAQYLRTSRARIAITLDAFHDRFASLAGDVAPVRLVLAKLGDYLSPLKRAGFWLTKGRRIPRVPPDARIVWWRALMSAAAAPPPAPADGTHDLAAILFSGGTTATPKAVALTNRNFIAAGLQASTWVRISCGDSILAILPVFHGFGLGVCVNAVLMAGGKSILVPTFTPATVARLIRDKRPRLLVGVPTLFESLARDPALARADLSCLRAAFCGADTLPRPVKERFEALVASRGGSVKLLEGYGLTEAVTGIMAMPLTEYREGSIGLPFPDMLAAICEPGTTRHLAPGEEGEICLSGPAVMHGYLDDPPATAQALRPHDDGRTWLHTGDLGRMDADGFFYFTMRLKRMIKSSGFNVYPTQVEAALYRHAAVREACVIGVPDAKQVERVKAFVVPKDSSRADARLADELIEHCRAELIKWSCPREIEFRDSLPTTRVGKIDYRALAEEEALRARR
jgi:long-chain acyl-CoA synthetase